MKVPAWQSCSCRHFCARIIKHPQGRLLVDTGWHRSMSPEGVFDKKAQVKSLGSFPLYLTNQGVVPPGQAADEQLAARGIAPGDLDAVLLTHLDCDHANGLRAFAGAKRILVAAEELAYTRKPGTNWVRYQAKWWEGVNLEPICWNGAEGPAGKSFDLFGDGSVVCVNIPGHADGLFAVKITGADGRFVLLASDGAYAARSWEQMVMPGIGSDRPMQRRSLEWIRAQSQSPNCVAVLANHDPSVEPGEINLG